MATRQKMSHAARYAATPEIRRLTGLLDEACRLIEVDITQADWEHTDVEPVDMMSTDLRGWWDARPGSKAYAEKHRERVIDQTFSRLTADDKSVLAGLSHKELLERLGVSPEQPVRQKGRAPALENPTRRRIRRSA